MKKGFFITGTDTDVGKTWVSIALMRLLKSQGLSVIGMKPVAAGCEWIDQQWKNEDALLLQENASQVLDYHLINPYAFEMPVSPHLAANNDRVEINQIVNVFEEIKDNAEIIVVEGAGGWFAPLNKDDDIADLAKAIQLPVIVVVGIRLGCINHARLTFEAIKQSGVECAGWVAMCVEPAMTKQKENIATIDQKTSFSLLGILPYIKGRDFDLLASKLIKEKLI